MNVVWQYEVEPHREYGPVKLDLAGKAKDQRRMSYPAKMDHQLKVGHYNENESYRQIQFRQCSSVQRHFIWRRG